MKAILVGAGGVARELLRRLGQTWEVTVVDVDDERLRRVADLAPAGAVRGDGSSRVVLRQAGLEACDAVVAATGDDDVNVEVLRLAREVGIGRLVAVARSPERVEDYRDLGVSAISPHALAARRAELSLETRRVSSMAFADGRAEAIEFRVEADSPARGKALKELRAHSFIVGAVLRGDELIVPHGDTVLEAGDLVTVVGAGADFAKIVSTFAGGEARFPLNFGKRVAVAIDDASDLDGIFGEACHLVRGSRASSVLMVHRDPAGIREPARADRVRSWLARARELADGVEIRPRPVDRQPGRALVQLSTEESVGVIVLPAIKRRGTISWARIVQALAILRRTGRPVMISRQSHPYRRILCPARRTEAGGAAMRAAIDLARIGGTELKALAVVDPIFMAGHAAPTEARDAIAWLEEEAAVQGIPVRGRIARGNPVRALVREADEAELLVVGIRTSRRSPVGGIGIGGHVARSARGSVLLVPA